MQLSLSIFYILHTWDILKTILLKVLETIVFNGI